jgi:hypothetical protein
VKIAKPTVEISDKVRLNLEKFVWSSREKMQRTPNAKFEELKKNKATLEQEVWVGTHSRGETPLT